ncbi:MAG: hypothetical protein M1818_007012 [Claussenomyces sp. TS43310]|nr:MAG: hypothetical protein M1818_007012 [Claussenomyces sp. TS43310]
MPKVISYTPAWLSGPAPGSTIFAPDATKNTSEQAGPYSALSDSAKRNAKPGPRRTIARRGTEIFTAVGKEIRWADLVYLKEAWEDKQSIDEHGGQAQGFRTIKTSVADDIRQLVISPHSNYLAILTTHTVHVAVLPDSSHLTAQDSGPLKLKTFTLGPITHVTSRSAVVSALWHPLGVNGSCLVTVTEDAVVRVWELSTADRWSFDKPTLAIDLKKLADGTSLDQDFGASTSAANKGFSPDSFEMEVASACFGGRESGDWSPMTLWLAMREGDVYALCPLLPEKWAPPSTLIPSLSVSIVAKVASIEDDPEVSEQKKLLSQQQFAWMSDLDTQEPTILENAMGGPTDIYMRPQKPGRIPRLQGPFELEISPEESEDDLDTMLSDIYVIGGKLNSDELMFGEEDDLLIDDADPGGLSVSIVCLLSSSGRVSICLDLEGVEAQWLPNTKSRARRYAELYETSKLLSFQVLDTLKSEELYDESWPMFSHDANSRYSFFVTHSSSITFISLSPWVFRLESELQGSSSSGLDFRLDLLVRSQDSTRQRVIARERSKDDTPTPLAACTVLRDPDIGYFLLTCTPHRPVAVSFEIPDSELDMPRSRSPTYDEEPQPQPLLLWNPRQVYQPPHALAESSVLPEFLKELQRSKYKRVMTEPMKLSPATLTMMTDAHKILSEETYRLGSAAAELFRRCERLQIELKEQINRANEVKGRVEAVVGDDVDDEPVDGNQAVEKRLLGAKQRQTELTERLERLKKKTMQRGSGRDLSIKEKAWIYEVGTLENSVFPPTDDSVEADPMKRPWRRFEEVRSLSTDLLDQVETRSVATAGRENADDGHIRVPSEVRKMKLSQITALLERETALVEAAKTRLERLSLA